MQFDFDIVAVPFRMQPGLRRLDAADPQLTRIQILRNLGAEGSFTLPGK